MSDQNPNYLDLTDYVVVRRDYHDYRVQCVERAQMKLAQFKDDPVKYKDQIRLLGWVLATEDAL